MNDTHFISQAVSLALKGKFNTKPGVNVGCVIVKNNKVIGQGFYEKQGGSHAEINAINQVKRNYKKNYFSQLADSDIYITLEPCSKKGKTGACVNELKKYDIVFIGLHGGEGENGTIQKSLEQNEIIFTGSDSKSSALCMDKNLSKIKAKDIGIPTPKWDLIKKVSSLDFNMQKFPIIVLSLIHI